MEEKILVQSSGNYEKRIKKAMKICLFVVVAFWVLFLVQTIRVESAKENRERAYDTWEYYAFDYEDYDDEDDYDDGGWYEEQYEKASDEVDKWNDVNDSLIKPWEKSGKKVVLGISILVSITEILIVLVYYLVCKVEIIVTDKRVYGTAIWGKRVDLPLDSISAIATGIFQSIAVATSSGRIQFVGIENCEKIHSELSKLLIERQGKIKETVTEKVTENVTNITQAQSSADEIKKFKELLDSGIITQEELDAKKKQLLGL